MPYRFCNPIANGIIYNCKRWAATTVLVLAALLSPAVASSAETDVNWSEIVVIDVRTLAEWNDGHLEGALWIPWHQIEQGIERHQLNPDTPLAFYCEAGIRAERAMRRLARLGFMQTYNLIDTDSAAQITGRKIVIQPQ